MINFYDKEYHLLGSKGSATIMITQANAINAIPHLKWIRIPKCFTWNFLPIRPIYYVFYYHMDTSVDIID